MQQEQGVLCSCEIDLILLCWHVRLIHFQDCCLFWNTQLALLLKNIWHIILRKNGMKKIWKTSIWLSLHRQWRWPAKNHQELLFYEIFRCIYVHKGRSNQLGWSEVQKNPRLPQAWVRYEKIQRSGEKEKSWSSCCAAVQWGEISFVGRLWILNWARVALGQARSHRFWLGWWRDVSRWWAFWASTSNGGHFFREYWFVCIVGAWWRLFSLGWCRTARSLWKNKIKI